MNDYVGGVSREKIIKAYKHFKSYRRTGDSIGLSRTTIMNVIKEEGLNPGDYKRPRSEYKKKSRHKYSFHSWVAEHEFAKLPRSLSEIAKISGYSRQAVSKWYARERNKVRQQLASLPSINGKALNVESTEGEVYSLRDLHRLRYVFDKFTFQVTIVGVNEEGEQVRFPIENMDSFERVLSNYYEEEQ